MGCKFLSCQQNAEKNHDIKIRNEFLFLKCGEFTKFGDNYDKSNSIYVGPENTVNSGNVF
jgi:hypothetical protein